MNLKFFDLMHQRNVGAVIFRILSLNFRFFCGITMEVYGEVDLLIV